jgi:DNA-binding CsgD family transcriptional regulator/tetratricopeptide (TPR) repeat protein
MIRPEMSARLSSPILIGRMPEMGALEAAFGRAAAGSPAVVLVGGEAGIGKSRLVQEFADRARDAGGLVLDGGCVSLGSEEGLPFAPIAEALRGLLRTADASVLAGVIDPATRELGRLVPELVAGGTEASSETPAEWAQTRLFDGFLVLLERLGERQPVVLVIEDIHWADRSTRDLLAFIARRLRHERVVLIATYRSDELHRRHPLRPWLAELQRLPRVEELQLERFDPAQVADQLAAIQGGQVPPALIDQVARRAEGNPFFAEELLAAGSVTPEAVLPARLRDVLLGRIASLSEPAGRLLAAASVAGDAVDYDLLGAVLGVDDAALSAALEEATSSHVLVPVRDSTGGGSYGFRHALLGEAVYDELLASERRRLHGRFAVVLAAREPPDGAAGASHLAALAHHAAAANDLPLALRASIASARASLATSGFHEAARAYERAMALWDSVPEADHPPEEDHVELLYEAAGAFDWALEPDRSREAARLSVALVDVDVEPLRAARLEERLAWSIYETNDLAGAISLLHETIGRLDGMPPSPEAAACLASLANFTLYAGRYREAVPIAEWAIAVSEAVGADGRRVEAMGALGASLAIVGDCERGLAVLRDALDIAKQQGGVFAIGMAYLGLSSTLYDCDALEESVAVGLEGSAWARGMRFIGFDSMPIEGLVPLGRWDEVGALLSDHPREWGEGVGANWNSVFAGLVAVRTGRLADAQTLVALRHDAEALLTDVAFAGNLAGGLLELALVEGRLTDARAVVDEGLAWLANADDVRFRARILRHGVSAEAELAAVARARRDSAAEQEARDLGLARLEAIRALMAGTDGSPVFAEARGNLALAEAETTRLLDQPDPGAWSDAAERFVDPPRPYELGWCRYRQAEAMLALRIPRAEVAAVLGEARALARELGAAPFLEVVETLARMARLNLPSDGGTVVAAVASEDPFGLTSREREVLELLVAGQTNRQIADALFISESTASVHVSNIIGKMGVANRVEAAAAAVRSGIAT